MPSPPGLLASTRTVMVGRALGVAGAFGGFVVTAAAFGANRETDVFNVAYAVPYAFLVVAGATLSQSFISIHARVEAAEGGDSARRFASACLGVTFFGLLALAGIGALAAGPLARVSGAGLPADLVPDAARQLLWLLPLVVAGGLANLAKGVLNARHVYFTPSLDTFATYAALIPVVWFGAPRWGIWALVAGTVAGNVARLLVLLPDLLRTGWTPTLRHPRLAEWIRGIGPLAGGAVVLGANVVLIRSLASRAASPDAVSHLVYAERLVMVPSEVVAASIGVALLPSAAARYAAGDRGGFARLVSASLRSTWVLLVPAAAGLALLARPLVKLVYEHGRFGPDDTQATAEVLRVFAVILPGSAALVLGQAFFAVGKLGWVVASWVAQTLLTGLLGWLLLPRMGEAGVALGYGLSTVLVSLGSLIALARHVPELGIPSIAASLLRAGFATGLMAAAVWFLRDRIGLFPVVLVGIAVYAVAMLALRAPEFRRRASA